MKFHLYCGSAIAASTMALAFPAMAQNTPAAEASAEEATGGEILVTARRREESTLDVPIAVSAFSGESLDRKGIERVDDLQRIAPSMSFRPTAGRRSNSQYELRGISATESLITGDPAVGVYVDEVYRARATGTNQSFYDIANVQVLYGPQGTLFGRNSTAGAVLINTKRPTDKFEGEISAGYGNLNRYEVTAIVNLPVNDKLAFRFAGQRVKRDGYGLNVTTGNRLADTNSWSGRASMTFKPVDGIENTTVISYYHANELGSAVYLHGFRPCPTPTSPAPAASCSTRSMPDVPSVDTRTIGQAVAQAAAQQALLGPWNSLLDPSYRDYTGVTSITGAPKLVTDPFERSRNFSATNITTIKLGDNITLKNIFGYNFVRLTALNDLDGTPIKLVDTFYDTSNRQFSDELQLQGEHGALTWVVGGMFFREKGHDLQNSIQNVYSDSRTDVIGINKSYALFAQATYKITDQLSLTAGGRYTWDKRYAQYYKPQTISLALDTLVPGTPTCNLSSAIDTDGDCIVEQRLSFHQPTYTVSVDYKPSDNLLFYVAHRRGYRSGGLQARTGLIATGPAVGGITPVANGLPFTPEKVKDVEIGFKGDLELGGEARLSLAIAGYQAWYTDLQRQLTVVTGLSATTSPVGATTTTAVTNVGNATVKGFTIEPSLTVIRGLTVGGYFGYVDGVYTKFVTRTGTLTGVPFSTSKYTAGANVSFTPIDTPEDGKVTFSANYAYRSSFTVDQTLPLQEPESFSPSQHNINLAMNWDDILGSPVSGQLWIRNLTNEASPLGFTALAGSFGVTTGVMSEPRTYGFNLSYKF